MADPLKARLRKVARTLAAGSYTLGSIDEVAGGQVRGWAFSPSHPLQPVELRLLIDDRLVTEVVADGHRPDVQAQGFGDGASGFMINLPASLLDGAEHAVDVFDRRNGQRIAGLSPTYRLSPYDSPARDTADLLFDAQFYKSQAGSVREPLQHYRTVGWRRGYDSHPLFDTDWYVRRQGLTGDEDPLTHLIRTGGASGATPHPLLDLPLEGRSEAGREADPPVVAYLRRSGAGLPDPSPLFSDVAYAARDPNVVAAGFLPLVHYLAYGWREGARPHPDFDPRLFARLAGLDNRTEPYTHFAADLLEARSNVVRLAGSPKVSIIILNFNKAVLTLQCLHFVRRFTPPELIEVLIIDNGSGRDDFQLLCRYVRDAAIVRLDVNRGFGEGNNIGAEHARGEFLVFLNNDAFVSRGWLEPLLKEIEGDDSVGAVGGKLLFPDGSLQEAGAFMSTCGTAVQRGKHLDPRAAVFNTVDTVDYCSAALLMVRTTDFQQVLGFDLCWDPAYYEDADLCLKLKGVGKRTVYAPACEAVHLEHGSGDVPGVADNLQDIITVNRLKFVNRWTQPTPDSFHRDAETVRARPNQPAETGPSLALYTPYALAPGGGERYLMTIAATLGKDRRCTLFTPDRYSRIRLLTLGRELGLDLDHVDADTISNAGAHERHDVFVCMGNEVLPPVRGLGRLNVFHCQFPFPIASDQLSRYWGDLATYDGVIVNSAFTADHYAKALDRIGARGPRIEVVSPPVPKLTPRSARRADDVVRILSVGRFVPGGNCKRQDLMVAAFARLVERASCPVELHLAGGVGGDSASRGYIRGVMEAARGLPVTLYPSASPGQIADLYAQASIYWHLTGAGQNVQAQPEVFEHFGIALVEAMSVGCVPVALRHGGPREIITDGIDGVLLSDANELLRRTESLLASPADLARMGQAAVSRASCFSADRFGDRLGEVFGELKEGQAAAATARL